MALFYIFLILHLVLGLGCAHLVRSTDLRADLLFLVGAILGGLGLILCWFRISGLERSGGRVRLPRAA